MRFPPPLLDKALLLLYLATIYILIYLFQIKPLNTECIFLFFLSFDDFLFVQPYQKRVYLTFKVAKIYITIKAK